MNVPPTITICRNIFNDINTWLDSHGKSDTVIVSIHISSHLYILNYNTTREYEEIYIPIEDIIKISHERDKEFQLKQIKELGLFKSKK